MSALFGVFFLEFLDGRGVFFALMFARLGFVMEFFLEGGDVVGEGVELMEERRDLGISIVEHGVEGGLLHGLWGWHFGLLG